MTESARRAAMAAEFLEQDHYSNLTKVGRGRERIYRMIKTPDGKLATLIQLEEEAPVTPSRAPRKAEREK